MSNLYSIIKSIQDASGRNEKIDILHENIDSDVLWKYLKAVYEPKISYYQTGIVVKNKPKFDSFDFTTEVEELSFDSNCDYILRSLDNLTSRKVTGHAARDFLSELHSKCDAQTKELLLWLIIRDLRAGISTSTINKVVPNLITKKPYMRCTLPKDSKIEEFKWEDGVYSEIKYDGAYCSLEIDTQSETIVACTRQGQDFPIELFSLIEKDSILLAKNIQHVVGSPLGSSKGIVLTGELEVIDTTVNRLLIREEGNGIINRILQTGEIDPRYKLRYTIWDYIPKESFVSKGKYSVSRKERVNFIDEAYNLTSTNEGRELYVLVAERKIVYSIDEAYDHFYEVRKKGLEGTVVKDTNAIWEDGDSAWQVKMKEEAEIDLVIIGFKEGNGRLAGTFGSMQAATSCGMLETGVSGITDEKRAEINAKREWMIGKVITVKCNSIQVNKKGGKHSVSLARFVEERFDKQEADSYEDVIRIFKDLVDSRGKKE